MNEGTDIYENKTAKIVVVDGPAGAGKTYLIEELVRKELVRYPSYNPGFVAPLERPRDYQDRLDSGAYLSSVKNAIDMSLALLNSLFVEDNDIPIVIDRGVLSQAVYGGMRIQPDMEVQYNAVFDSLLNQATQTQMSVLSNYIFRLPFVTEQKLGARVANMIYLPGIDVVAERRAKSEKRYPFDLDLEWHYWGAVDAKINSNKTPVNGIYTATHFINVTMHDVEELE